MGLDLLGQLAYTYRMKNITVSLGLKMTVVIFLLAGLSTYFLQPQNAHPQAGLFREAALPARKVVLAPGAMLKQIEQVLEYIRKYRQKDAHAVDPGLFSSHGVTLKDVEETLIYCRDILNEDSEKGKRTRLRDPSFIKTHFRVLRWYPEAKNPTKKDRIRITKYAVFTIDGREKRDNTFKYALYELPDDENGMSLQEARKHKDKLSRFKYTKQMVLAGAYEKGGAKPLIWVRRHGLEKALMQGTICVKDDRNRKRYFNVCRGNGVPYDPTIDDPKDQARYWYFAEVKEPKGYGMDSASMVTIYPDVAFAGDVVKLGLGKLLAIAGRKMRLGILADTGGAFTHGLDRLDYYTGVFYTNEGFWKKAKTIPEFAEVYILIKRRAPCLRRPCRGPNFY